MHYIPGTTVTPAARSREVVRPGMNSNQLKRTGGQRVNTAEINKLKPGVTYTLSRVYKKPGDQHVTYKFTGSGEQVELQFENTKAADKLISQMRGEEMPDYDVMSETRTD